MTVFRRASGQIVHRSDTTYDTSAKIGAILDLHLGSVFPFQLGSVSDEGLTQFGPTTNRLAVYTTMVVFEASTYQ